MARDLAIARVTGGRMHICHVSSARSVELVRRAKAEGVRVTAEVTPHHLVFTDDDLLGYDTNFKVNPPLRTAEDRDALRAGVADGTIDAIATDHAPHAVEEKESEFDLSPPGTIGLETALAAVLTYLVDPGIVDAGRALEAMSSDAGRILGAAGHGGPIERGASGEPRGLRSRRALGGRAAVRVEGPQLRVHRASSSPAGSVHDAARRLHRHRRQGARLAW